MAPALAVSREAMYFERQQLQQCLRHSLNNLLQVFPLLPPSSCILMQNEIQQNNVASLVALCFARLHGRLPNIRAR